MIKAVVFDLDDTLISEFDYIKSGFLAVSDYIYEKLHIKVYDELLELYHTDKKKVFDRLLNNHGICAKGSYITEMVSVYRNHIPKLNYSQDVLSTLLDLKSKGLKLGIITDGYYATQKNKLDVLNAYQLFDKVIITDELGRDCWKPNPKAFDLMKDYLDIQYEEMMYVGDNPEKDFYIGNLYPIHTVRLRNHEGVYYDRAYYQDVKERYHIDNIKELLNLVNYLNTQKG